MSFTKSLAWAAALTITGLASGQNLITNPSFEATTGIDFAGGSFGFQGLGVAGNNVNGWTSIGGSATSQILIYQAPFSPTNAPTPSNGSNAMMLNGDGGVLTTLVSSSFGTLLGESYFLSFDIGLQPTSTGGTFAPVSLQYFITTDPNPANIVSSTVASGSAALTLADEGIFRPVNTSFVSSTGGPLYLIFQQSDGAQLSPTLDNVSVTLAAVPEPQTYAAGALALATAGWAFRRRRQQA